MPKENTKAIGILEIKNRTENWQTGKHFCPLHDDAKVEFAQKLLNPYNKDLGIAPGEKVQLELFWVGTRDYLFKPGKNGTRPSLSNRYQKDFAECYRDIFPKLHEQADMVGKKELKLRSFENLRPYNYAIPQEDDLETKLFNNLLHTEIDIVLATSQYLFVGEAKHESKFGKNRDYVLPHQLVRQYVMARVLLRYIKKSTDVEERTVVPFVVGDDPANLRKSHDQVRFMMGIKKLHNDNILPWEYIKNLSKPHTFD